MLTIIVNETPLHIPRGTSMQLEANSSIFSTEKIQGDIVFTFDIPAEENDEVFRHARFTYVQRLRKLPCAVSVGGVEIARGDLYIQKATDKLYSCGLVVNPFPTGFADAKLSEDDYGGDLEISATASSHNAAWVEFLRSTLAEDSQVKFPLFIDTAFYGSGNADFGWFLLPSDTADDSHASGFQASLQTNDSVGMDRCYINRLFFDEDGNVIVSRNGSRGIRLFNNREAGNPNSFAFCPALRLTWLLEKVVKNGGYNAVGGFFGNAAAKSVFSQSLRALDGQLTQFANGEAGLTAHISPEVDFSDEPTNLTFIARFMDENGNAHYTFTPRSSGTHRFSVTLKTYLPANVITTGTTDVVEYGQNVTKPFVEAMFLMVLGTQSSLSTCLSIRLYGDWSNMQPISTNWVQPVYCRMFKPDQLSSFGYAGAGFYELHFDFTLENMQQGRSYRFIFAKCRGMNAAGQGFLGQVFVKDFENIPITEEAAAYYGVYNCFANTLRYSEHVPAMTNADFISTICNAFGLAFFVDSSTRQAEFSFIRDILEKSGQLDLSQYAIDNETSIEKQDEKKYVYKIQGISSGDTDETKLLSPVVNFDELPDALSNYGKSCFVENENGYRTSVREGDAVSNWVFRWKTSDGADRKLEVGDGDEEEVSPSFKVPTMKVTDEKTQHSEFLMQIETAGCSPLFDTGSTDFEMVLVSYFGRRRLNCTQFGSPYFEEARPTCLNRNGIFQDGISLTISGEKSVGELWVKPWLDFLAGFEKVKYRFLLPLSAFLQLWQLLKPQNVPAERQTRWLIVNNVRSLPIKITFQFTEGRELVVAEVEAAKRKVEL